jgi:hypothetical protein
MLCDQITEQYPEHSENICNYIRYDFSELFEGLTTLYASNFCDIFGKYGIVGCVADGYDSPKQYNFTTDRLFSKFTICADRVSKIISENLELFTAILEENHTSCSGFISFYDADVDTAIDSILSANDDSEIYFTDYLQLINELEYGQDNDFYSSFEGYMYDSCNGNELLYNTVSFDLENFLFNEVTK